MPIDASSLEKLPRAQLIELAKLLDERNKRYVDEKIRFYVPCCTVHNGRMPDNWPIDDIWQPARCPKIPCPDSKHTKFHLSKARNRVVFGGNRSSKTFTCTLEFLFRMCLIRHPFTGEAFRKGDRHGRILAQDYKVIEKKHIPMMKEWIPTQCFAYGKKAANRQEAWEKSYDSRNAILHLVNGWIDFCTYEQDSSKGESVDLDAWFADEEIPEDWYHACNSRIVTRQGVGIMGVTPLYQLTWAMSFLDGKTPNVDVFKWGIRDNPHNSNKSIDDFLAGLSPLERESRENGDFIEAKGTRYKELDATVHLIGRKQPESSYPVIMSMDPHQRKGTAITWAFINPYDQVTFFDELQIQGSARDVVNAIYQKEKGHKARTLLRIADPAINKQVSGYGSQRTTLSEFEEVGMGFTMADNNEVGYSIVEQYVHYDKSKPLTTLNAPAVYFTEDCPMTWYSMTHLRWDEYKFGSDRDPKERVKDKDKDFADDVRYTLALKPKFYDRAPEPVSLSFNVLPIQP